MAWWARDRNTGIGYVQTNKPTRMDKVANEYIPLYPNRQDLTDEEIEQVWTEVTCQELNVPYSFARAIIRKAQSTCNGFCGEYECKENQDGCKRKAQEK